MRPTDIGRSSPPHGDPEVVGNDARHFRTLFRDGPVGIAIVTLEGAIAEANGAVHRIFGYEPDELVGRVVFGLLHPDDVDEARDDVAALIAGRVAFLAAERRYHRKDGTLVWLRPFTVVERGPDGLPARLVTQVIDLSARRRAEEALRASEGRYRGIVESQQAAVMRVGLDFRIGFVNEHCSRIIGVPAAEMIGQDFSQWIYDEDRDAVLAAVASQIALPPHRAEAVSRVKCAGGVVRWFEWEGSAVLDDQGIPVELQAVGRDVTERHLAEEALRASHEQLQRREQQLRLLTERQVSIREEERRRLGFDLHDGVCQELVGTAIIVESVRRRLEPHGGATAAELDRVSRHLYEIVEHVRQLAGELRPMLLADLGLVGGLRSLVAGMATDTTAVHGHFASGIPRLADDVELGLYRIAQEALANAMRHAGAERVDVTLDLRRECLALEVRDDGCGFDPGDRRAEALGLTSMAERAQALGGRFEILSQPGEGTTVRVALPFGSADPT